MIAHVAQSGEDRGRVVLQLRSSRPSAIALEAALRIARAFQSEIEGVFVQDEQLIDCASYGFVHEISLTGRQRRALSPDTLARDLDIAAAGARRQVEEAARRAAVPLRCRIVRDEPLRALSIACAETGPWNVVALGDPFTGSHGGAIKQMLLEVAGATGLVLVGPQAQRTTGPAIVAVEDIDHLSMMLKAAERLAALDQDEIILLLVASDEERLHWMDGQARLVMDAREDVRIVWAEVARGEAAVVAETLRKMRGGFVIGQFGGLVVPDEGNLRPLSAALECPLFLVR